MVERILDDYAMAHGVRHVALRYFNAAGADPAGEIGEARDVETHLVPLAIEAILGLVAAAHRARRRLSNTGRHRDFGRHPRQRPCRSTCARAWAVAGGGGVVEAEPRHRARPFGASGAGSRRSGGNAAGAASDWSASARGPGRTRGRSDRRPGAPWPGFPPPAGRTSAPSSRRRGPGTSPIRRQPAKRPASRRNKFAGTPRQAAQPRASVRVVAERAALRALPREKGRADQPVTPRVLAIQDVAGGSDVAAHLSVEMARRRGSAKPRGRARL